MFYFKQSLQWIENEFFYGTIDKPYFEFNEFKEMLAKVGLENVGKLKKGEWNIIRKAMGKPRRFSNEFLKSERKKLEIYRNIVREYLQNQQVHKLRSKIRDSLSDKIVKISPFRVGQIVMSIHPNCKHFHAGSVLTTNGDIVIVKFLTNDLGVLRIPDTSLSVEYTSHLTGISDESVKINRETDEINNFHTRGSNVMGNAAQQSCQMEQKNSSTQAILQDLDFFSMAFLIKLLDRKTLLINELKEYNELAIKRGNDHLDEVFYQKYGWTGIQINLIDNALKHVIAKFRLRGLNHYNQSQIAENFGRILQVPLSYIERELEDNPGDSEVLGEIKNISNKNSDEKIQQSVNVMISRGEQKLMKEKGEVYRKQLEDNYYSTGYGNLLNIIYNCVGILQTLKSQGDINITQNAFLNSLASSIYSENAEQFLEINDVIQDILQKHKDKKNNPNSLSNKNNLQTLETISLENGSNCLNNN